VALQSQLAEQFARSSEPAQATTAQASDNPIGMAQSAAAKSQEGKTTLTVAMIKLGIGLIGAVVSGAAIGMNPIKAMGVEVILALTQTAAITQLLYRKNRFARGVREMLSRILDKPEDVERAQRTGEPSPNVLIAITTLASTTFSGLFFLAKPLLDKLMPEPHREPKARALLVKELGEASGLRTFAKRAALVAHDIEQSTAIQYIKKRPHLVVIASLTMAFVNNIFQGMLANRLKGQAEALDTPETV
jgi:hypothetical protein